VVNAGSELEAEDGITTFVIRIRTEGTQARDKERGWVAHITNVLDQSERYVRDLDDLMRFIEENLTRMGVGSTRTDRPTAAPNDLPSAPGA